MKKLLLTILALTLAISMAIPALAADQLLIYDFTDADKDGLIGWNEGLSAAPYNIPKPDFIVKDGQLAITPKAAIGCPSFQPAWKAENTAISGCI